MMGAMEKKKVEKEEDGRSQAGQCGAAILNTVVRETSPTKWQLSRLEGMKGRATWSSRVEGTVSKGQDVSVLVGDQQGDGCG